MRKYIAYTVMIITVLLAGCVRNDNTQPATYNISLETLGANETFSSRLIMMMTKKESQP